MKVDTERIKNPNTKKAQSDLALNLNFRKYYAAKKLYMSNSLKIVTNRLIYEIAALVKFVKINRSF